MIQLKNTGNYALCLLLLANMLAFPGSARAEMLRCESQDAQYTECGRYILEARVTRQISTQACRRNLSFGLNEGVLWVDQGCAAEFDIKYFRKLAVAVNGNGNGTIRSQPAGINCGKFTRNIDPNACFELYPLNQDVSLTAQPEPGAMFKGWAGACSGTTICHIRMNSNQYVTAKFKTIRGVFPILSSFLLAP